MAINWDEIRKKAQAKGQQAESQVNFTRATPSLPRANTLPKATVTPINPSTFRNAPSLTKITPDQQAKNQALAVEELSGKQGNIASFARGAALATLDPFGIRKLTPQGSNVAQEQASAKNMYNIPVIKNPRAVSQGLKPVETGNIKGTYEGLGEFAGSMVGVDPVGIGLTKGIQKGIQIANKAKIPVLMNGVTKYVDAPVTIPKANVSAPVPRTVASAANAPVEQVIQTAQKAENLPVQRGNIVNRTLAKADVALPDLPVRYNPDMKNEARNFTDHVEVGDKFNALDSEGQKAVMGHENAHNISNDYLFKKGYFQDILNNKAFGESKIAPDGRTYWEGIFGDVGATSVDETLTDTIAVYLRNPEWLKEMHPQAYDYISEKVMKSAPSFKGKPQTLPRASSVTVQPILPQKGTEIPTAIKTPETAQKNEIYKKALMQTALDEYDRTIVSIADYISNYKPKGVDIGVIPKNGDELMRDGGIRYAASKNDLWYQDFYKKHGRKPSKSETKELATQIVKESLRSKSGEFYNPNLGKIVEELHGLKKDLGADTNIYNQGQKVSKVKSNTFQNSEMFTAAEKDMLNDKSYNYDVVSEQQSLAEAKQRLEADFDGEVTDLQKKSNFDGVDSDTAMGILETYIKEARETGDYSKVNNWTELIQDKGTQGGQLLQSFAKYSRTPEGALIKAKQTVAKVERDIEKTNPNLIEKVKKETKQTTDAIKKAQDETVESLGELIARYTQDSAKKLSTKISIPGKSKTSAPLQQAFDDLTKELYKIARETLPTAKTSKKEIDATSILKTAIENKQNYQDVWENAKFLVQRKYANNPEAMVMLNDFFNKEVIPNFSKKTLDTAINQSAKDFGVDLGKIIKSSQGDKIKLAKDIQDYVLYKVGVTGEDAKTLADELLAQYNTILKTKTESALKQMFPEAFGKQLPAKASQKTVGQKVMELINMGAYDNQAIKNIIKEKNDVPVLENSEIKTIVENMELAAKETDPYMKNMYSAKAEQIISNKIPAEFREKFRAMQRLSLILNPKTLLTRNPLGNVLLGTAENVKDIPGTLLDKAISLKTGQRTTTLAPIEKAQAQAQGMKQGFSELRKDIKYGVDTSPSRGQFELPSGRVFKNPVLNALDMFERRALQLGDRPFYQSAYNSRIAELKKLGKVGEEAETDARLYALDRVFQNNSELSKRAVQIRKSLGLPGDLLMPFTQTPANIMDKLIDYSPAGLAKAVYQLGSTAGKGTFNQKKFVDTLARTFTGGGIAMLTYAMFDKGILKGSLSDNQDVRQAEQLQGKQYYSIKIGDKWYSYDWAQPIAGIMAATADAIKAGATKDDISEAVMAGTTSAVDSVFNQSFLSGILTAFSGYSPASGLGAALLGATSQATPTVGSAIAKTIDPVVRETYDPNTLKQQGNKLIARLPFASKTLLPKVDVKGQPILQSQGRGLGARAFENFLAPFKISKEVDDKVNAELMRIQSETGDNAVLLNKTPKGLEKNNEKYIFTTKEYTQYQTTAGQKAYNDINSFMKTPEYKDMTDSERAEAIKKIHANALESAQVEMFKNRKLPVTLALDKSYQEKYDVVKSVISDQKFYDTIKAMQSGGDSDIQKAYAIQSKVKDVPMKVYDELGISEESYATANLLKSVGVKPEDIEKVYLVTEDIESDKYINSKGNESSVSAGSNLEKRGEGQSASLKKKLAIDQANPNATRAQLMALYIAFDVSEKVW